MPSKLAIVLSPQHSATLMVSLSVSSHTLKYMHMQEKKTAVAWYLNSTCIPQAFVPIWRASPVNEIRCVRSTFSWLPMINISRRCYLHGWSFRKPVFCWETHNTICIPPRWWSWETLTTSKETLVFPSQRSKWLGGGFLYKASILDKCMLLSLSLLWVSHSDTSAWTP